MSSWFANTSESKEKTTKEHVCIFKDFTKSKL